MSNRPYRLRAVAVVALGLLSALGVVGCQSDSCFSPLDLDDPEGNAFHPTYGANYDHVLLDYMTATPVPLRVGVWQFQQAQSALRGPRSDSDLRMMTVEFAAALRKIGLFESVQVAASGKRDFDLIVVPEIVVARSRRRDTFTKTYLCTDLELRALVVPGYATDPAFWIDGSGNYKKMYTEKYSAGNTMRAEMYQDLAVQVYSAFLDLGSQLAEAPAVLAVAARRQAGPSATPDPSRFDDLTRMIAQMRAQRAELDGRS